MIDRRILRRRRHFQKKCYAGNPQPRYFETLWGSINSMGLDAVEHILCGASAVQIGTQFMREGTACFSRIAQKLCSIMQRKGYADISDVKGKLKSID